ncbi:MAG TPA: 3-deoxy-D-manno-octulosonic acid transferase [Vicinamibacteria bacterium]|nr:3-deoxy-D-manno-octulosonic acid transferase [Vicinamibacteria bacterium]
MHLFYNVLYGGLLVGAIPYLLYRSVRETGYANSIRERLGFGGPRANDARSIWIHAVSVGEVVTAAVLLPRVKEAFPQERIVCSVTTVTGRRVAEERLVEADEVFFCPFDLPGLVRRVVRLARPRALLIVETEIWPNLFREARRAGARTMLVNGRISDESFPRYRRLRWFLKRYLRDVDRFLMQSAIYAERIVAMGAPVDRVSTLGSLKFDGTASAKAHVPIEPRRTVLMGGSTLEPEESILLSVFSRLRRANPELLLALAPRHPARFGEVHELARSRGLEVVRRSSGDVVSRSTDVLLLDTLGELAGLYEQADVVFVGGSLANWGGHNIIEPAEKGKPVLFGPHMENFPDVARLFLEADAAIQVTDERDLEEHLGTLLKEPARGAELSRRALGVIEANRGAAAKTVEELVKLLG